MKTGHKVLITLIIIGVVLLLIGATIFGVSFVRSRLSEALQNETSSVQPAQNPSSGAQTLAALRELELKLGAVDVTVVAADRFALETGGFDAGELSIRQDEQSGALMVEQANYKDAFRNATGENSLDHVTRSLTLYVDAAQLEELDLELGRGTVQIESISAQDADFNIGAGRLLFEKVTLGGVEMTIGAGELDCTDCAFTDFELKSGASTVSYAGTLSGECTLESGVGKLDVLLQDGAENYRFTCEQGIGKIQINGSGFVGVGSKTIGPADAPTTVDIRAGLGSIEITTDAA